MKSRKREEQVEKSHGEDEDEDSEDAEVMRGTVERRTTTTLIKEEKSPINQQTVRMGERLRVRAETRTLCMCVFVDFSCFRAVVCTS